MAKTINIIDLFAGPGGLGEGFSSVKSEGLSFRIRMSVERETSAHTTLTLRAFYRLLKAAGQEKDYFRYVEGDMTKEELTNLHPIKWKEACEETLNGPTALGEDNSKIESRLLELKKQYEGQPWVVIGGPPCQAYSLVGRARNKGIKGYAAEKDTRHFLYQEYLKVLSIMEPDVFVMENVKGILSSKVNGELIFPTILNDLQNPGAAAEKIKGARKYRIYSFVKEPDCHGLFETSYSDFKDFIIKAEDFGVPQTRHRVILLGIAEDIDKKPEALTKQSQVSIEDALYDLPPLRSKLSKQKDSPDLWKKMIAKQVGMLQLTESDNEQLAPVLTKMGAALNKLRYNSAIESTEYLSVNSDAHFAATAEELRTWLLQNRPSKVLNHRARSHMDSDLGRYLFSSCWASQDVYGNSDKPFPKAADYPELLAPEHANWKTGKFADRFRVQRTGRPATTITSHISKDGHYFIHYDPTQCRSLSVREAARIQTFPDNYFFEGNRTQQYVQVGNAVPPYLAKQLAKTVLQLLV